MKQKILVTGGAGYIGSHTVVELHNNGYVPVIVDNFSKSDPLILSRLEEICGVDIECHNVDCTDKNALSTVFRGTGPIHAVIHFAAYKAVGESVRKPLSYYHNNVGSLLVLLDVMKDFGVKNLVFSSSCTVYGQPDELPVTEESILQEANSPYGYTKQVCERMLQDINTSGNPFLSSILLRYFNPIGAHPSGKIGELPLGPPENLVPYITQTAAGLREKLTVFGNDYDTVDGTCIRDYIHVVDLAKAHVVSLNWLTSNPLSCGIFNLGTGHGNSVQQVLDTFEKVTGTKVNYSYGDRRPGDVEKIFANVDKAERELSWNCEYTLADALSHAWNWEKNLQDQKIVIK